MLVIERKKSQRVHIGEDIILTITQIKGNRVKLGIEAPQDVVVLRGELKQEETRDE